MNGDRAGEQQASQGCRVEEAKSNVITLLNSTHRRVHIYNDRPT